MGKTSRVHEVFGSKVENSGIPPRTNNYNNHHTHGGGVMRPPGVTIVDLEGRRDKETIPVVEPSKILKFQNKSSIDQAESTESCIKSTRINDSDIMVQDARNAFNSGKTRSLKFREHQLKQLLKLVEEQQDEIIAALHLDLRKSKQEGIVTEIDMLKNELRHVIAEFSSWSKPEKPSKTIVNLLDGVVIYKQPYGVVLVIGSWNYPFELTLAPVIGAIAAGNTVIIKPSEVSSISAHLIAKLVPKYLDKKSYQVFLGGPSETSDLLKERFDYIFYTGSTAVGRLIHKAANKHLTPVTLELGGKSPVYIDNTVDMDIAVKRILWGKCVNLGQTCIAPDYVLCSREVQEKFISKAKEVLKDWFGEKIKNSPDLCRIVSEKHYQRLVSLLKNGRIAVGGDTDASQKYISPTILVNIKPTDPVMQEEIFGPILPMILVKDDSEAIDYINKGERPLTLYIFSTSDKTQNKIISQTSSGSVCINETLLHFGVPNLPFGGVGYSGMGAYHGKHSFDTFTHRRSCLNRGMNGLVEKLSSDRYPPYSDSKTARISFFLKKRRGISLSFLPYLIFFALGIAVVFIALAIKKAVNHQSSTGAAE